jgi:hypothetical protein
MNSGASKLFMLPSLLLLGYSSFSPFLLMAIAKNRFEATDGRTLKKPQQMKVILTEMKDPQL